MLSPPPQMRGNLRGLLPVMALAVVLTLWQHASSARGQTSLPQLAARAALRPLESALSALGGELSDSARSLAGGRALLQRVRELEAKVDELEVRNIQLNEHFLRYKLMVEKYGFGLEPPAEVTPVRVIASSGTSRNAWVRVEAPRGRELQPGDIVREKLGLVGRILETESKNVARVWLLTDRLHAVAAIVQRSRARGMVYPLATVSGAVTELRMGKLPRGADIRQGDTVLTSGLGGAYPAGLPIGTVKRVEASEGVEGVTAIITPFVDFERLDYLYIERRR